MSAGGPTFPGVDVGLGVIGQLRDLVDEAAADSTVAPSERIAALRRVSDELTAIQGRIETYIAGDELRREGAAILRVRQQMGAQERAAVREEALRRGIATEAELDASGFVSRDELARLREEGLLGEHLEGGVGG